MNAIVTAGKKSLISTMARGYGMEPETFQVTVFKTCMPQNSTNEEFAAFLLVANEHGLNPVTREIYAFPKKGGGIQPIVGIDGWMTLINSHPSCNGMQFEDHLSEGKLTAITCKIYRKDRDHPTEVTEYMNECVRPTEPWQKWPARMLRHKSAIQCARYAFGFAGIIDPEEAERSPEVETGEVVAPPPPIEDSLPHETPDEPNNEFDPEVFLADLEQDLLGSDDLSDIEGKWDERDVESTLTDHPDVLQRAFDIKNSLTETITPPLEMRAG